jgi:hypothetical protein
LQHFQKGMNYWHGLIIGVWFIFSLAASAANVVNFCTHYLKTAPPNEMRCVSKRSNFADSVVIVNIEPTIGAHLKSQAFFVGGRAHIREMYGLLETQHLGATAKNITFKASDSMYIFEVTLRVEGNEVLEATWRVLNRDNGTLLETARLTCFGSLWQNL